ncbi:MAG: phosphoribosylformylglycinamidine synthase subunit PurQ [Candidatus Kapabacteria bacterium]|jgi:phosphoribosylformylglycinamidine synthase|nr:phosphoribosylformylglycinamidine synthase subunit PurQ [Candidatus Kapabacteria bacterium]
MKTGVVIFPGSNCDRDALYAASLLEGTSSVPLWHKDTSIPADLDCIILPGGFSYGDYLRCGAIARFSPVMQEVVRFAGRGGFVVGICNGFQILAEAGLVEGALLRNTNLSFICRDVYVRVERTDTAFTNSITKSVLRVPIAHGEGNYFADSDTIKALEDEGRIVLRYANAEGNITQEANPNGSINNIAGIMNKGGNVFGMMPHPERASDAVLGNTDGLGVFASLVRATEKVFG